MDAVVGKVTETGLLPLEMPCRKMCWQTVFAGAGLQSNSCYGV